MQFYEHDEALLEALACFVATGLIAGVACVVVATPAHREGLHKRLSGRGLRVRDFERRGQLVLRDAADLLRTFMRDGSPDPDLFQAAVGAIVRDTECHCSGLPVRVFGEMVDLLCVEQNQHAALLLEHLWNDFAAKHSFTLLCAYPIQRFARASDSGPFRSVCHAHTLVLPVESTKASADRDGQLRAMADLQQRACALEAEVAAHQESLRHLEELNRRKDEFLAMLGHELRNPLGAIQNAVLAAQLDPENSTRVLGIARRQVDQLKRLLDDLLDVTRITQGRVRLKKERLYLATVLDRAIEAALPLIDSRNHALSVTLPCDGVQVEGDAARIEQAIVNLLSNAAKYTDPGGRIELSLRREDAAAVVCIADSGIGIAPEMLPHVFEMFTQLEQGLDRAAGGLGLGLAIARRIAEMHGGWIEAGSDGVGKGSEFVLRLPALRMATEPGLAPDATTPAPSPTRARALIVEDNRDAAAALAMLLEMLGHDVETTPDGRSALAAAELTPPDVMLIDIGLPDIDGYTLAGQIRARPELESVVLAAITGYGQHKDRTRAKAAGFDHHLVKPVDVQAITSILEGCRLSGGFAR